MKSNNIIIHNAKILLFFITISIGFLWSFYVYENPVFGENNADVSEKSTTVSKSTTKTIRFGIYTSDKPTEMYRQFKPIIDYLQKQLSNQGLINDIELKIYSSYSGAIDALVKGECDFARFGPASYILAKSRNKEIRLLAMEHKKGKKRFNGVLVVANVSPIQSIDELKGKTFAFGNKNSTIGRYLSQAELVKKGIRASDLKSFNYLGRHDKVALAVAAGKYDAGVIKEGTYNKYARRLKKIGQFPNVTKPWIARAGLNNEIFTGLQKALLYLKDKKVLNSLKKDGFLPTDDEEYDFVRNGMIIAKQF